MKHLRLVAYAVLLTGLAACQRELPAAPALGESSPTSGLDLAGGPSRPHRPRARLAANPSAIQDGQSSTLTWTTANATTVTLNGSPVAADGSQVVSPTATTTYTLVASNAAGSKTATATVTVSTAPPLAKPTASLGASPGSIQTGQNSTLTWTTANATTVTLEGSPVAASGSQIVSPTGTTTYSLVATNAAGSTTATATVTVTPLVMSLTYVRDIQPILTASCVSCHSGSSPSAGLNLSTYAGTMTSVTPGSASSPLVVKTQPTGSMYRFFPAASAAQSAETIRRWVVDFNAVEQ